MVAQGAAAWQSIGLPLEQPSDEQLNDLYHALNATFQHAQGIPLVCRRGLAADDRRGACRSGAGRRSDRAVGSGPDRGVSQEPAPKAPIEWPDTTTISITRAARYRDHEPSRPGYSARRRSGRKSPVRPLSWRSAPRL